MVWVPNPLPPPPNCIPISLSLAANLLGRLGSKNLSEGDCIKLAHTAILLVVHIYRSSRALYKGCGGKPVEIIFPTLSERVLAFSHSF